MTDILIKLNDCSTYSNYTKQLSKKPKKIKKIKKIKKPLILTPNGGNSGEFPNGGNISPILTPNGGNIRPILTPNGDNSGEFPNFKVKCDNIKLISYRKLFRFIILFIFLFVLL